MLLSLHIENYALIRQSDICFDSNFVAITGETGAGKSIMLGALTMLLGQRADAKSLYNPDRKCVVEAHFDASRLDLRSLFEENDVDSNDDGLVIIRREVLPNAKSRAFVNDTPVGIAFLRQLGSILIDIHSQHATLLLADSEFQTALLDSIGKGQTLLPEYKKKYSLYIGLKRQLEQLTAEEQRNRKDYDYNKFLFDELDAAKLTAGEQEELEKESTLLANAETIKQTLSQVLDICDGEEDSLLSRLNNCKNMMGRITSISQEINEIHERFDSSLIELRDIASTIESINSNVSYSPEEQARVDERLGNIYRLQKKHGVSTIEELIAIREQLDTDLNDTDLTDRKIHEIMEAVDKAFVELQQQADKLTAARTEAALTLKEEILPLLADLGMGNASIEALVEKKEDYSPMGNNKVTLFFNANKGGQPRELGKVASGGEMSRLMLAIKALTARNALLPTIIFDEIDTGISGDTSMKVGRIMHRMAQGMQVIAITHLPQIAARATQHFKVYKQESEVGTESNFKELDHDLRRHELAVMLSSDPPTQAALQTAEELMG